MSRSDIVVFRTLFASVFQSMNYSALEARIPVSRSYGHVKKSWCGQNMTELKTCYRPLLYHFSFSGARCLILSLELSCRLLQGGVLRIEAAQHGLHHGEKALIFRSCYCAFAKRKRAFRLAIHMQTYIHYLYMFFLFFRDGSSRSTFHFSSLACSIPSERES